MAAAAMLSRGGGGRQWVDHNGDEDEVEVEMDGVTVVALGGGGRQNGRFDESSTTPT